MLPTVRVHCPYCGEPLELAIDQSVDLQRYVEDCAVCCRPIEVAVAIDAAGEVLLGVTRESDA
jgi:hypothetical protein